MKTCPVLLALAFAACATAPEPAAWRGPYVKPGLVMLTADQAEQRGIDVRPADRNRTPRPGAPPPLDSTAVVVPAEIKVYALNRSVDSGDPNLMHEEHVVYRRETDAPWRLDAPASRKILVGPRITDGRQDLRPLLSKELAAFLSEQRRITAADHDAIVALFKLVDALNRQQQSIVRREIKGSPPEPLDRRGNETPGNSEPEPDPAAN